MIIKKWMKSLKLKNKKKTVTICKINKQKKNQKNYNFLKFKK